MPLDETKFLELLRSFVQIPSKTDAEHDFIKSIMRYCHDVDLPSNQLIIDNLIYATVPPLLVGNANCPHVLVTHCDRVCENKNIQVKNDILIGRLDNAINIAFALLLLESKINDNELPFSILITTSEEKGNHRHKHGGRGFIEYLSHMHQQEQGRFEQTLSQKIHICLDVRPLDKGDVYTLSNEPFELGDGIIFREAEIKRNLRADHNTIERLKIIAQKHDIKYTLFPGKRGITELGRGFEVFLKPMNFNPANYKIAWIQLPLRNYHTAEERISLLDVIRQWDLLNSFFLITN